MALNGFLIGLAVVLAATAFATVQGVRCVRLAKRTGRAFAPELDVLGRQSSRLERNAAALERSQGRLEASTARLNASRARLQVLLDEIDAAKRRAGWLTSFLPR